MTGGGNFTTNQGINETITVNHSDTSTLSGTYGSTSDGTKIDQITVDARGHVTAITTGATGSGNGTVTGSGTANYVSKWTSSSAQGNSTIYDNGNVGIGTTNPGEKLTISGGNLLVAGDYQSLYVGGKTDSSQDGIRMSIDNAGNGYFDHRGSGLLNFRVDSSTGATTRMVINSSGNIGIGTTSPQTKLHVANGTLRT